MTAAPLPAALIAAIPGIVARLTMILGGLAAVVARAFLKDPVHVGHIVPLWTYITRTARRFARVLDRLAAGTLRPRAPRPGRRGGAHPRPAFPTRHAWLVAALRHEVAGRGSQLRHLLEEPETAALLAAAPQAARLLRPLCRYLGVSPAPLAPAPRAPGKARVAPPASAQGQRPAGTAVPALPPPDRPLPPLCPRLLDRWPWRRMPVLGEA